MWIISKNLNISHSVPATEELISDLNELSERLSQSLMWRSKPSPSRTWLRRLKTNSSIQLLSGRILKHSTGVSFVKEWISCRAAFLVNRSPEPGGEKEIKTNDISFPSLNEESKSQDRQLSSWRTSKESCQVNSAETIGTIRKELRFSSMSSESWKELTTQRRSEYSQRAKSALLTNEKESLFLQSQTRQDDQALNLSIIFSVKTEDQEGQSFRHTEDKSNILLNHQGLWGTPRVGMSKAKMGGSSPESDKRWKNRIENQILGRVQGMSVKKVLNPRWVEMLMGIPIGWTSPSCIKIVTIEQTSSDFSEMESFPIQPNERFECFGKNWATPQARDHNGKQERAYKGLSFDLPAQVEQEES